MKNKFKYTKEQIKLVQGALNEAAIDYINDGMHCSDVTSLKDLYNIAKGMKDDIKILKQINSPKPNIKFLETQVRDMLGYASIKEFLENFQEEPAREVRSIR